jgi:hypothetical protein
MDGWGKGSFHVIYRPQFIFLQVHTASLFLMEYVNEVDSNSSTTTVPNLTLRTIGETIPLVLKKNCGLYITWNDPFPQPSIFF